MKYCQNCGLPFDDNTNICSSCGTKNTVNIPIKNQKRKGMKVLSIICFVFSALYALIAIAVPPTLAATSFFVILGIMFFVLSKSPKGNRYILNKTTGIKKTAFSFLCVAIAFLLFIVVFILSLLLTDFSDTVTSPTLESPSTEIADTQISTTTEDTTTEDSATEVTSTVTLSDIQKWYENQIPQVTQILIEYSKSVNGISNINITKSNFRFGEDSGWYDCHYTIYFTCKVNGELCTGEARGFMEYGSSDITWFHYEIFRDADWATIVEHYDDSYDLIIENYYKELIEEHK